MFFSILLLGYFLPDNMAYSQQVTTQTREPAKDDLEARIRAARLLGDIQTAATLQKELGVLNHETVVQGVNDPSFTFVPAAINTPPVVSAPPVVNAPPVESPPLAAAAEKPPAERAASPAKTKPPGRVAVMDRPPRPQHQRMSKRAEHLDEFGREAGKLHNHVRQRMGHYNLSGLERLGPELSRALAQFLR